MADAYAVGRRYFQPMTKGQQSSGRRRLIKLVLIVLLCGFVAGPIIFYLFSVVGSGRFAEIRSAAGLGRMLTISGGFGALMSISFFVTCGLPAIFLYPALRRYPRTIYLTILTLIAFSGGLLGFLLPSYLMFWLFGLRFMSEESLRLALVVDGSLAVSIALVLAAFEKLRAEVGRTERLLYESKLNEQTLAERHANAQLKALQAQINPHFLFNTLSSIATLSSIDAGRTKEMIISLAEVYRHILRSSNRNLLPIEEEIEMVRRYLSIEEVRFRDRLRVEIDAAPLGNVMLPGLVLQPIVENAIRHGIARNLSGGSVSIRFERGERDLTITVRNSSETLCDLSRERVFVEGHALKNVNDRLTTIYGDAYAFTIANEACNVCATLKVPLAVKAVT